MAKRVLGYHPNVELLAGGMIVIAATSINSRPKEPSHVLSDSFHASARLLGKPRTHEPI